MNKKLVLVVLGSMMALTLQSCSNKVNNEHVHNHMNGHDYTHGHDHTHGHDLTDSGFIKSKGMYFKLAPDTEADGDTHLDFYFRDADGEHLPGAQVSLVLISPKQESESFDLTEDVEGEHYHVKTKLSETGEYQSVVKVIMDDENYNLRFVFVN